MRINHNISALNAWRSITNTQYSMGKTLEKLSSGLRIIEQETMLLDLLSVRR